MQQEQKPRKNKKWVGLALVALALLCIAGTAACLLLRPGAKKGADPLDFATVAQQCAQNDYKTYYRAGTSEINGGRDAFIMLPNGGRVDVPQGNYYAGLSNSREEYHYLTHDEAADESTLHFAPLQGGQGQALFTGAFSIMDTSGLNNAFLFATKAEGESLFNLYGYYEGEVSTLAEDITGYRDASSMAVGATFIKDDALWAAGLSTPAWQLQTPQQDACVALPSNTGHTVYIVQEDATRETEGHTAYFVIAIETAAGGRVELPVTANISDLFGGTSYEIYFYFNASGDEALIAALNGMWLYKNGGVKQISEGAGRLAAPGEAYGLSGWRVYHRAYSYPVESFEEFYYYRNDNSAGANGLYLYTGGESQLAVKGMDYAPYATPDASAVLGRSSAGSLQLVQRGKGGFTQTDITGAYSQFSFAQQGQAVLVEEYEKGSYTYQLWQNGALAQTAAGAKYCAYSPDAAHAAYIVEFDDESWTGTAWLKTGDGEAQLISSECSLISQVLQDGSVYYMENAIPDGESYWVTGDLYLWQNGSATLVEAGASRIWSQY